MPLVLLAQFLFRPASGRKAHTPARLSGDPARRIYFRKNPCPCRSARGQAAAWPGSGYYLHFTLSQGQKFVNILGFRLSEMTN
jgi:hypothetical protein